MSGYKILFFHGSGSGLEKFMESDLVCPERLDLDLDPDQVQQIMDPDPVCPKRLDPDQDPVNIRPDPKPRS